MWLFWTTLSNFTVLRGGGGVTFITKESPSTDRSSSRFLFRIADAVDATVIFRASSLSREKEKDAMVVNVETSYPVSEEYSCYRISLFDCVKSRSTAG